MRVLLALVSFILLIGCANKGSTTKSQQMYTEVMQVHDEVMPKMRDIRQYKKKLNKIEGAKELEEVQNAINSLDQAHDSMMDWMAQFKLPKDVSEDDEIKYLEGQKVSVKEMSDELYGALEIAANTLERFSKE